MKTYTIFAAIVLSVLLVVGLGACSKSSSDSGTGSLGVSLTDASATGFDAVNVTVVKVRVHQSANASENDAGWSDITLTPARKINLLKLTNGVLEDLGQTVLPSGHYTQLRLVLSANTGTSIDNSVVLSGTTTEIPLVTPSAVQSGIKLISPFDVADGQHVDIVLDFDALKSIVPRGTGSYALNPVISVVPVVVNGIGGFIDTAAAGGALATAQVNGAIVRSTTPNPNTGLFFLARLDTGTYDVVITVQGRATAIVTGVPISSSSGTAQVSTSASPITLPTSSMRNISGIVTLHPADSTIVPSVAAKQTAGSTTVTVMTQNADQTTGAYSLSVPADAPMIGQYGSGTLPIALNASTAVAGKYSVEATASGYQTQSQNADVSSADVTQSFTMAP